MSWASYLLAALALVLAWPAPVALSRADWTARAPFTAMVLWQSIALAGGLSMIGAMLIWGLEPLGDDPLTASANFLTLLRSDDPALSLGVIHVFAISAGALLFAHLLFTLILTFVRIRRQRNRHRDMLALLSSPAQDQPATLVISHPAPVAYCLPGGARSVTVMSDSLLEVLTRAELDAVLTHEHAHLHQRHDLLLWAFAAWRAALPWLPTSQLAQSAVAELIEMLADDEALRHVDRDTLIRAIVIVGSGTAGAVPEGAALPLSSALANAPATQVAAGQNAGQATARSTAPRVRRLLTPLPPLGLVQQTTALATAGLLLIVPPVLLVVPGLLG